VTDT